MYLNIGPSMTVKKSELVGIFDIDEASSAHSLKVFLARAEKQGKVFSASDSLPKSFVLLTNGNVWFSPYSTKVLRRRAEKSYIEVMIPKKDYETFCKKVSTKK